MLDEARLKLEMRLLAEERADKFAGKETILLTRRDTARICGRSEQWVANMIALNRLPTIRIGPKEWVQRPVVIEALVNGV
jgi:hypothetical protein